MQKEQLNNYVLIVTSFFRILIYLLSLYFLYVLIKEILLAHKIIIPAIESLKDADNFLLLFGGLFLGTMLLVLGKKFNNYAGIFLIAINVTGVGYLVLQAIN